MTLLCDSGERYRSTHLDDAWLKQRGIDIQQEEERSSAFLRLASSSDPSIRFRTHRSTMASPLAASSVEAPRPG